MKRTENKGSAKFRFFKRLGGFLFFLAVFALLFAAGAVSCSGPENANSGSGTDNSNPSSNPGNSNPGSNPDNSNPGSNPDNSNPGGDQGKTAGAFSPNAQRLMNYLADQYSKKIISGQMDTAWTENKTMDMIARVFADTGKYPALKGFDFIDLPHSWSNYGRNQINEAIEWWEGKNKMNGASTATQLLPGRTDIHGIVSFCWHWKAGSPLDFYTDKTDFRIPMKDGKLDTSNSNAAFQTIKSDLEKVAALLKLLKDRDIPVLWRPLHEAAGNWTANNPNGAWFWWGASGPAACVALWEYMYDYLTNEKGLDNLIWVWNGQNASWFPNPETVHIISYDVYLNSNSQSSAQQVQSATFRTRFNDTKNTPPEKNLMVALSENGAIPDPQWSLTNNAMWSWFMTWNDSYGSAQGETNKDNFWTGDYHNTPAHKTYVYNHELVITLDELPDLTAYRLE